MKLLAGLDKQNRTFLVLTGYGLIACIGVLDYLTGNELAFSVFYVIPIFLITWAGDIISGLAASLICAATWLLADAATAGFYSSPFVPLWNSLIRLTFFVIITLLLSSLKFSLRLAHTDTLTAAANSRYFQVILQMEIDRFQRYRRPFTVAYIDLDNFKTVNDQLGHLVGNNVLCTLVNTIQKIVRRTDTIARLGGDEFIVLFPETDEGAAHTICTKLQNCFLDECRDRGWPVTISVGVITCRHVPPAAGELIQMADTLMYRAKSLGKNTVEYSTHLADQP